MTLNPKSGMFFKWEAMFRLHDGSHPLTRHAARVVRQWPLGTLEIEREIAKLGYPNCGSCLYVIRCNSPLTTSSSNVDTRLGFET